MVRSVVHRLGLWRLTRNESARELDDWLADRGVRVGFVLLAFGGLRLVRHADVGFGTDGDDSYYLGWTVVHVYFVVLCNYYLAPFVPAWNGWLAALPILLACPVMVSGYRSYKTATGHALAAGAALLATGASLWLELGGAGAA